MGRKTLDYIHINLDITQSQKMQILNFFDELFNFNCDLKISVKSMLYTAIYIFWLVIGSRADEQ